MPGWGVTVTFSEGSTLLLCQTKAKAPTATPLTCLHRQWSEGAELHCHNCRSGQNHDAVHYNSKAEGRHLWVCVERVKGGVWGVGQLQAACKMESKISISW